MGSWPKIEVRWKEGNTLIPFPFEEHLVCVKGEDERKAFK